MISLDRSPPREPLLPAPRTRPADAAGRRLEKPRSRSLLSSLHDRRKPAKWTPPGNWPAHGFTTRRATATSRTFRI